MTKFQKQMLTIAAAGALTAVTALPALAFENEFHGLFNFNTVFSNYNNSSSGNIVPTKEKNKMNNYMEQRARIQYIAKASDDLKMVTQFEIDNQYGKAKSTGTNGTNIDTDTVNVEVKHAYLDFNIGKNFNTKLGMQPYKDTLKGIFVDADVAAVTTKTKIGAYTLGLGFSRLNDSVNGTTVTRVGDLNKDLFMFDNTFAFSKDTKAALSYYFLADYTVANKRDMVHTLGLSAETKLGPVALSGFAAMQAGHSKGGGIGNTGNGAGGIGTPAKDNYHGWAANVAAKANVGPGVARTGFLFVSGDNGNANHSHGWASTAVQSYNESGLIILTRNTANSPSNTDQYIRRVITNQATAYMGYNAKLTDKFNLDGGVGFAWVPASVGAPVDKKTGRANASDFMGTEIGLTAGYQLYKNLKLMALGAYMINGGYYKGSATEGTAANAKDPENPYTMRLQARYSF